MSKTGYTKKKILEMLKEKKETLTDLSNKLNLAPSTVSQHLQELVNSGQIRLVMDRPRKWKYYELNTGEYGMRRYENRRWFYNGRILVPIAIVSILAVFAIILYTGSGMHTATAQQVYLAPGSAVPVGSTLFSVSDSPTVYSVNSLVITINSASIHKESDDKLYSIPLQTKTFNLVKLDNISSIMSGVKLGNGTYDYIILDVSNVSAVVNGTEENVILPSDKLVIYGNFNVSNNRTDWINLDFNLSRSLHVAKNGDVIMFPVIKVSESIDRNLKLNNNYSVIVRGQERVKMIEEYGMNYSGDMEHNFAVPTNVSVDVEQGNSTPIAIRPKKDVIIDEGNNSSTISIEVNRRSVEGIVNGPDVSAHAMSNSQTYGNTNNSGNSQLGATGVNKGMNINGNMKVGEEITNGTDNVGLAVNVSIRSQKI